MTKLLLTPLFLLIGIAFSQDCLVNTYSSYTEIYGGAEDSGIDHTEIYIFVAYGKIQLTGIQVENEPLNLKKGDTLQIIFQYDTPYGSATERPLVQKADSTNANNFITPFSVIQRGNTYYAYGQKPLAWSWEIPYICQKKNRIAKPKSGFDAVDSYAAP